MPKNLQSVTVFAPASIGNIGPGFDVLGLAVTEIGDWVMARRTTRKGVRILSISGSQINLPYDPNKNTVGIAAKEILKRLKPNAGIELLLYKNIPGNGLGSSAASAVAGGFAANLLFGNFFNKQELLLPCAKAESSVSGGYFLDNIAASLLGGVVLTNPLTLTALSLGIIPRAILVLVTPHYPLLTKHSRKVLPNKVPLPLHIQNMAFSCSLVAAVDRNNIQSFGASIQDAIVEPIRSTLIPGFREVKKMALQKGAMGCSISGSGSTIFAVTDHPERAKRIGKAMQQAFKKKGLSSTLTISRMDRHGVRAIKKKVPFFSPW